MSEISNPQVAEINNEVFADHLRTLHHDAVLWKAKKLYQATASPDAKEKGFAEIVNMLCSIDSEVKRDAYADLIIKDLKIKSGVLKNAITNKLTEARDKFNGEEIIHKLPAWTNKNRVYNFSLDWRINEGHSTGYYFTKRANELEQLTNFVLEPLFHIYDRTGGNRRLAKLHNAINPDKMIELPSKAFISLDKFEELLADEGYYQTLEGFSKPHLKRLFRAIGNEFPKTYELKVLGWQPEGFWAYSNMIFDANKLTANSQRLTAFNDIGVCKFRDIFYYSPAASSLYMSERKDDEGREVMDDDPYENDKYLRYQKSPVTFQQYAQHMMKMHLENGMPLICYAFVSLFKDIITAYEKCPLLYGYGIVQSGKSTWAEGLYYLFYDKYSKPFNLNQGTVYAFFNRMERFRNCPQLFNEFDEDFIDEEFFRAFKSFYDGEGRDRGKGIKGKTETQKINCTVILVGQTLTTRDGASVLIRSIPVNFRDPGERSDIEKHNYDIWNAWTNSGVNSCLTEIIQHRKYFKENFFRIFNEELVKLKTSMRESGDQFKERIVKNYCILLAAGKVMIEAFQANSQQLTANSKPFDFSYEELFEYSRKHIISLSRMISEVDNLAIFWKTVEFLYEKGDILEDVDFKINEETEVRKKVEKEIISSPFDKPTKILYLRLTKIYPLYAQNFRQTTGSKPINERTLVTYFESNKQFIGNNPSSSFEAPGGKRQITSSYMFNYAKVGINLERQDIPAEDLRKPAEFDAYISKMPELIDAGGMQKIMFSVKSYEQVPVENNLPQTKTIYTKCFFDQVELKEKLLLDVKIKLLGMLQEKKGKNDYPIRIMEVEKITLDVKAELQEWQKSFG
jgi:hypothetical protein